ncbi:FmdB family transcriptional regulator [Actinobaculum sp. 352]|nr:FmdB family transcriptional regulator [Actinobaculum sp. 313]RTE49304.1 FmdB family transcriptional regulator [Actinobaculum sp. 352]
MPTYSYHCTACGNEFDIHQSFSDDPLTVCEACGGHLRKLFNSVGIVFKGSGFYHNDARSSSGALRSADSSHADSSSAPGDSKASSSDSSSVDSSSKSETKASTSAPGRATSNAS